MTYSRYFIFCFLLFIFISEDPSYSQDWKILSNLNCVNRAVLTCKRLWIMQYPAGASVFSFQNPEKKIPDEIHMDNVLDVCPFWENPNLSIVLMRDINNFYEICVLDEEDKIKGWNSINVRVDPRITRLFRTDHGNFILTSEKIIDIFNPKMKVKIRGKFEYLSKSYYKSVEEGKTKIKCDENRFEIFTAQLSNNHIVFDNYLYFGYGLGEFGGGYFRIKLDTGELQHFNMGIPTTDFYFDREIKSLLMSSGLSHMFGASGNIYEIFSPVDRLDGCSNHTINDPLFIGNNYQLELLGIPQCLENDGLPIMGLYEDNGNLKAVIEQNYILDLTNPTANRPKKIEYKNYDSYRIYWVNEKCAIVNLECCCTRFLGYRIHMRAREFDCSQTKSELRKNNLILVARDEN